METCDTGALTPPERSTRLKTLDRVNVLMPPEVTLPMSERVYALEPEILDDPMIPSERDQMLVERLGALMCEPQEVVAICGITKEQFNHIFAPIWARGRERAKARLRLMQWDAAAMGSERMLVHLGKQYLDQTEKTESNTLDEQQRQERQRTRDKLADAINRAGERRTARLVDGRGTDTSEKRVEPVGEGQPTPASGA